MEEVYGYTGLELWEGAELRNRIAPFGNRLEFMQRVGVGS